MTATDTIVALATVPGAARRAILRLSGPAALTIASGLVPPLAERLAATPGRSAAHELFVRLADDGGLDVPAGAWVFVSPRSATGEDVVELHLPGSPYVVQATLRRAYALGARQAEPGEFTARAFFNGKLSLDAAEGVVATISASNRGELDAARRLLSGELARRLATPMDAIARTLALVEAGIDFAEEDVSFISHEQLRQSINDIDAQLDRLLTESTRFERIVHEPRIVLAGRPNAGKSTLLNALSGTERAVVSPTAGTTRDALHATVALRRGLATLIDVAGLDLDGLDTATDERIARQMHDAALAAVASAEVLVLVIESADARPALILSREPDLIVRTKRDQLTGGSSAPGDVSVSAITGNGFQQLIDRLDELAFPRQASEQTPSLALNARHVDAIERCRSILFEAVTHVEAGSEFTAQSLRGALDALGGVLGTISPDDVLGRIFSSFCIGK